MKKIIICIAIFALIMGIIFIFFKLIKNNNSIFSSEKTENVEENINKNSISYTGWLKTSGAELQNEHGEKIQLKGLSSHGIQWFPDVITYDNLKELKENWHINVFRIAMYTDQNVNGYIAHPEESKALVKEIVQYAKDLDLYVIIDWHILSDNNPQIYKQQSIEFFDEMSREYADTPNVIYEICNEPNGYDVKWETSVKPYAEELISTIRKNCPKSLIIVGTTEWCKGIKNAADDPINTPNIVYACHFYAGSHRDELRSKIDYCREKNIPIFVSECGITDATGNGRIYEEEFKKWIEYLNNNNISWVFWSFCNKDESSSILTPEYKIQTTNESEEISTETTSEQVDENTEVVKIDDYLTETGIIIKSLL